ncbi:MAG TPA: hypothetical protein EYG68_04265 [Leucothrix mucor]|nr:hypothetical protein [Leucothrix mucor]
MSNSDENTLIPVVSDLVIPGNPRLKKQANEKLSVESNYTDNFNQRIDELESAIGQDDSTSLSRAYAIREEANRVVISNTKEANDTALENNDQDISTSKLSDSPA